MREKETLRTKFKAQRARLSPAEVDSKSGNIIKNVVDMLDWKKIKTVHVYNSINSLNEIRTGDLINFLKTRPEIQITLAAKLPADIEAETKFDLIVVPTLAFDNHGYRLGMGGGWYDRFLATQPQAIKIGLAYSGFKVDDLPHEAHDVRLDKIVTEDGLAF